MAVISSTGMRSRRAVLFGALGGVGALVARSIGAPDRTDAASAVQLGASNTETNATTVRNTSATAGSIGLAGRSVPASGIGLQGFAEGSDGKGVYGFAGTGTGAMGVYGAATQGHGVQGYGVIGVVGNGTAWGVYGNTGATNGIGVNAIAANGTGVRTSGLTTGVDATATADGGIAVNASATGSSGTGVQATGGAYGVHVSGYTSIAFVNDSAATGVYAKGDGAGGQFVGGTYGVFASGTTYGVYAQALTGGTGIYGLYCAGNMGVSGTINPSAVVVKIDHPQAPERKWLSQSLISSGEALNMQSGTVTLDANGQATVLLPGYFAALTGGSELRYQLTAVGGAAPSLHVAQEVTGNQFRIAGGMPGLKVSWQVSGVRRDDYALAHPLRVETRKSKAELGTRVFVPKGSTAKQMDTRPPLPPRPRRPREGSGH